MQESLIQAKREQLCEQYGMQVDQMDSRLSPEGQNEWLDYILEFERQFEVAQTITVRERIGNPPVQSVEEIPLYALEEVVNNRWIYWLNMAWSLIFWGIGTSWLPTGLSLKSCWTKR
ncbi:MAG: hypothetical protein IPL78_11335 [Chloroflexi bacterium]|nr:hypothetical protein [Chloroflexota bacterium]